VSPHEAKADRSVAFVNTVSFSLTTLFQEDFA